LHRARALLWANLGEYFFPLSEINFLEISNEHLQHLLEVLSIVCISVPTLFTIFSQTKDESFELARKGLQLCDKISNNQQLTLLRTKLYLFLTTQYLREGKDAYPLAQIELDLAKDQRDKLRDETILNAIQVEIIFAQAAYSYKCLKKNYYNPKNGFVDQRSFFQKFCEIIKPAEVIIENNKNEKYFNMIKAKIALLKAKVRSRYETKNYAENIFKAVLDAKEAFRDHRAQRLVMIADYTLASLKLEYSRDYPHFNI